MSPRLVDSKVRDSDLLSRAWGVLRGDDEIQELLKMSNVMTVGRLLYNDHGPVHAAIVAGSSLEIMDLLVDNGVTPTTLLDGTVDSMEEARLVVLLGAYLHDIGNSIHRDNHELMGALMADSILDRILPKLMDLDPRKLVRIKSEVKHIIYSTAPGVQALTIEAGIVKVADATDMAEGRARIPYIKGKMDMHALSALSIKSVEIKPGSTRPVRIEVRMTSYAGFFQLERVLLPKARTTTIDEYIEIIPVIQSGEGEKVLAPIYP